MPKVGIMEWRDRNPLRAWRNNRATSAFRAAGLLGVSVQALTRWESGAAMPNATSMALISELIGDPVDELQARWAKWRGEAKMLED